MKEIGRTSNVTKEMTDLIFEKDHKGISVADNAGTKVEVDAFVLYQKDMIKDKSDDLPISFILFLLSILYRLPYGNAL